jgi:FixJ family two-component response regulator
VDDDIEIRQILALTLSEAGYDVTCFADGPSLMSATRAKAPACILLDIGLPDPSGLQILEKLRNRGDLTPIIIVSGANDIRTAVEAFKKGAIHYVEKPFSGSDLLARVKEAISTTSGAREAPKLPSNFSGCELLSQREWEILERCAVGASTREIAKLLALSPRTVRNIERGYSESSAHEILQKSCAKCSQLDTTVASKSDATAQAATRFCLWCNRRSEQAYL